MPELPEVETIKEDLKKVIRNKQIAKVEIRLAKAIRNVSGKKFIRELIGDTFLSLDRRGKYLIFSLASGKTLIVHLGMTGRLVYSKPDKEISDYDKKFSRLVFILSNRRNLSFIDMRGFGGVYLLSARAVKNFARLALLGPEPLSKEFTFKVFKDLVTRRKATIKTLLLDQHFLAGIGNIYCAESLWRARISPVRRSDSLSLEELKKLYGAIRKVLSEAVASRGTTVDTYVDSRGRKGSYQFKLRVYGKEDAKCPRCKSRVARIKQNNRSTYFCPQCQK
jgi:formamidopyrimidine-DNA glycosylase